jgi:hypothetical protein
MKFSGLRPLEHASNLIDVTLDGVGDVDLRNDAHITEIRFVPGPKHMTIVVCFGFEDAARGTVVLEFLEVELTEIEPYLTTGVDPTYGYALLQGIDHWFDPEQEREGFSLSCTVFELSFYAVELRATVVA